MHKACGPMPCLQTLYIIICTGLMICLIYDENGDNVAIGAQVVGVYPI